MEKREKKVVPCEGCNQTINAIPSAVSEWQTWSQYVGGGFVERIHEDSIGGLWHLPCIKNLQSEGFIQRSLF